MKPLSASPLTRSIRLGLLGLALGLANVSAHAAAGELTVMSTPSMKEPLAAVLDAFKKESGLAVATEFVAPRQLRSKMAASTEHADVVVSDEAAIADLQKDGRLAERAPIGRTGLGIAMQAGKKAPDVSSPDALKQALLAAPSVLWADPSESAWGRLAAGVVEKLGVTKELQGRVKLGTGNNPLGPVGFGDAQLGLHSIAEILQARSVSLVAPVPAALQQWIRLDAGLVQNAPNESDAKRLMKFLGSPAARAVWMRHGIEAPQP